MLYIFALVFFKHSYSTLNPKPKHFVYLSFSPLALLNAMWKIEGFSGNENALSQNEGCAMFLNEDKCENEVMKKTQEKQSLETKESRISKKYEKNE